MQQTNKPDSDNNFPIPPANKEEFESTLPYLLEVYLSSQTSAVFLLPTDGRICDEHMN
ncbi:hypothetical protein RintRC_5882 [Richelia intracellularis]|nr:hypothetical protein RintRC_5882 [Richelia intracellularis]